MPDIMSPAKRSALMARVRTKNTQPERAIFERLDALKVRHERHPLDLPGRPDAVFREAKVAVFIDGDFWHGWRFPAWKAKLSEFWQEKIEANRRRDARNFRKLRGLGWKVLRIWEHQVEANVDACVERLLAAVTERRPGRTATRERALG